MQTIHSPEPKPETFKVSKRLGQGGYGEVYLVTSKQNTKFAIKVIDISPYSGDQREMDGLLREVNVLSRICHQNIIKYHWSWQTDSNIYIQTEYCYHRDLWVFVKEHGRPEEEQFINWIHQISSGLQYLHEKGFLHRNIKPSNIMVTEEKILKLGDFGTTRSLPEAGMAITNYVGTPYFMSPEMLNKKPYSQSTDIWSLGCTCYAISKLESLNEGKDWHEIVSPDVLKENSQKVQYIPYSDTIKCLISSMLKMSPDLRPTARDVKSWTETLQLSVQETTSCEKNNLQKCENTKKNVILKSSRVKDLSETCPAEFFHGPFGSKFSSEPTVDSNGSGASTAAPPEDNVNDTLSHETDDDIEFEIQRFLTENLGYENFKSGLSCIQNVESDNAKREIDLIKTIGKTNFRKYKIFFQQLRDIFLQEMSLHTDLGENSNKIVE